MKNAVNVAEKNKNKEKTYPKVEFVGEETTGSV